jgi:hypothetical protein
MHSEQWVNCSALSQWSSRFCTSRSKYLKRIELLWLLVPESADIKGLVTRLRDPDYVVQSNEEEEQIESFCLLLLGIWQTTAIAYEQGQIDSNMYRIYCDDVDVKFTKWPALKPHALKIALNYPAGASHEIFTNLYKEARAASA